MYLDLSTLLLGFLIFLARVTDVTIGTVRTISIVHGRTKVAFFLGFIEVLLWLIVSAKVLQEVMHRPILAIFYALGFSTGNVVGILLERRLAFGHTVLHIISAIDGENIATSLRAAGFSVTTFQGQGMSGPVLELYVVSRRRELNEAIDIVNNISPDAFYITEPAGIVSRLYRPIMQPATGWRAIFKKK